MAVTEPDTPSTEPHPGRGVSIRTRIMFWLTLVALLGLAPGLLSIYYFRAYRMELTTAETDQSSRIAALGRVNQDAWSLLTFTDARIRSTTPADRTAVDRLLQSLSARIQAAFSDRDAPGDRDHLLALWAQSEGKLQVVRERPDSLAALSEFRVSMRGIGLESDRLLAARINALKGLAERSQGLSARALRNLVTFLMLVAIALGLALTLLPRQVLRPLRRLSATLRQAEEGNLNVASTRSGIPELDRLAASVDRTLGRLRHFDSLKTRRVREEQRLRSALMSAAADGLAVINPGGRIARSNKLFQEWVGFDESASTGHAVSEVMGEAVGRAVSRVQAGRVAESLSWSARETSRGPAAFTVALAAVKDEWEGPPRVILRLTPAHETK